MEIRTCLEETGRWAVEGISKGQAMNPYRKILTELRESQNLLTKVASLLKTSASKEDIAKARETLKDKSYKDPESGKDISFSTAYNRSVLRLRRTTQKH